MKAEKGALLVRCMESMKKIHSSYVRAVEHHEHRPGLSFIHLEELEHHNYGFIRDVRVVERYFKEDNLIRSLKNLEVDYPDPEELGEITEKGTLLNERRIEMNIRDKFPGIWMYFRNFSYMPALFGGVIRRHVRELAASEKELLIGTRLWPRQSNLLFELSETLRINDRFEEALPLVDEALEKDPGAPLLLFQKGMLLTMLGGKESAAPCLLEAIERGLDENGIIEVSRIFWAVFKDQERAISISDKIISVPTNNPSAYALSISLYIQLGKFDYAKRSLEKFYTTRRKRDKTEASSPFYNAGAIDQVFSAVQKSLSIWHGLQSRLSKHLNECREIPPVFPIFRTSFLESCYKIRNR